MTCKRKMLTVLTRLIKYIFCHPTIGSNPFLPPTSLFCICSDLSSSHHRPPLIGVLGGGSQRSMKASWPREQHTSESRSSDGRIYKSKEKTSNHQIHLRDNLRAISHFRSDNVKGDNERNMLVSLNVESGHRSGD
ncbi:hypothetical protein GQ457_05G014650 [Hibiscus cannabinus]